MRSSILILLFVAACMQVSAQKLKLTGADNGLSVDDEVIQLGGLLKKTTTINGSPSLYTFNFSNLGNFNVTSNNLLLNSKLKTTISSTGEMDFSASALLLKGASVSIEGPIKLKGYQNIGKKELTVDATGNLVLVDRFVPPAPVVYSAGNGISANDNVFSLGGALSMPTTIAGNQHALSFSNLGRLHINASQTSIEGDISFGALKNNDPNLILSADASGKLVLVPKPVIPAPLVYAAANGLSLENNVFSLGGVLSKSTTVEGNKHSLDLANLGNFNLQASKTNIEGDVSFGALKNNDPNLILSADASGKLVLVPKPVIPAPLVYAAANGLSLENDVFTLGGVLSKSTTVEGNKHSLDLANLGNFNIQASKTNIEGDVSFGALKNNDPNLILSADASGKLVLVSKPVVVPPPPANTYSAGSGLTSENNTFALGGDLNKSTSLNANTHSISFLNTNKFTITGSEQQLNSTTKTVIASTGNVEINAGGLTTFIGDVAFGNYKNLTNNSFLSVDETGKLKLVPLVATEPANGVNYVAENGLSLQDNKLSFGGSLSRSTGLNGNFKNLRFTNLDTFFLGGRHVQFINSTRNTTISSFDSLNLRSFNNLLLSGRQVDMDGKIKLTGYKNTSTMDSLLTVDDCGNLKLVSQKSLQTIAQNAFMNGGNNFGIDAALGTNDAYALNFKTSGIVRGFFDVPGTLNLANGLNISFGKLKTARDIELNGGEAFAPAAGQKSLKGINFVDGTLINGTTTTISSGIHLTSLKGFNFYTEQSGVPLSNSFPDLTIDNNGQFIFGGRKARIADKDVVEPSAAYHFRDYYTSSGAIPKGILFPNVGTTLEKARILNPAVGLMFYNKQTNDLEIYKPGGWHRFVTEKITPPPPPGSVAAPALVENVSANNNSYVQALGDGTKKSFKITHNLNAQYVMVQFLDCGPEANCNLLQIMPQGARVELDGKNNALVTFDEAPSFNRYKIMFLRVQ